MSRKNDLQILIENNARRLQKLKEQQVLYGISADPHISIEIDDIESEIEQLKLELETVSEANEEFGASSTVSRLARESQSSVDPAMSGNSGIIISGGTINAEQLAVGSQAKAVKNVSIVHDSGKQTSLDLAIIEWMNGVEARIAELSDFDDDEKEEIVQKASKIKDEVAKGENANIKKLERWLNTVVAIAPDILDVTIATLENPFAGVGLVLGKINDRIILERQEKANLA